jgi:CheY-like chemotaxis protein
MNDVSVLILDDDLIDRMSIERFCKRNNISFHSASNGTDALNLIKNHQVGLVFSDIDMPQMDGLEFVKKLQEYSSCMHSHIPVIAVTGNEEKALKSNFKEYGFDYFISKPPLPDQLSYVLSHFINK